MPFRYPADDPPSEGPSQFGRKQVGRQFSMFTRPCVYATRVDGLPTHPYSNAWIATLDGTAQSVDNRTPPINLQRHFAYQNTGYQPYVSFVVRGITPVQTLYCRKLGTRSSNGGGTSHQERFMGDVQYPVGDPQTDQGNGQWLGPAWTEEITTVGGLPTAHTDAHVLTYDPEAKQLYEVYGYRYGTGPGTMDSDGNSFPNCFMAKHYNAESSTIFWTGNTADESGQIIYPMLPKYSEIVDGAMEHAIRFNAPAEAMRAFVTGSTSQAYIWPANNGATSGAGKITDPNYYNFLPFGAWCRIKDSYDISGYRPQDTQIFLTCLKKYGMILSDIGESWSMVGTANEQWPAAMLTELTTVPTSALEFVDQTPFSTNSLLAFGDW